MLRSIKTKVLAAQVGLVVLMAIFIGIPGYMLMKNYVLNLQQEKLVFMARSGARRLEYLFTNSKNRFRELATDDIIKVYAKKYHDPMLYEYFLRFQDQFPVLSFVNADGMEEFKLINGEMSAELDNISDTLLFQEAIHAPGELFISSVTPGDGNEPTIRFALNYVTFFDKFIAVITGDFPLSNMMGVIEELKVGNTGFAFLIDQEGNILWHPKKDHIFQILTEHGKNAESLLSGIKTLKTGFGRATLMGVDGYAAYAPVKDRAWSVVVILPYNEFIADLNTLKTYVLWTSVVFLLVACLVAFHIAGKITNPLIKLAAITETIAKGDLSTKVEIGSHDEIGMLSTSFNKMIEDLKTYEEERYQLEARLRQTQRIEALGTLAGGIAHDFNNILGTILGYTEYLLNKYAEDNKERKYLERVYQAGEQATDLVRQILTFSHTQGQPQLIPTNIVPILEESLKMMRATIPANIEIRQCLQPNCRPILADATQIRQVIVNLCVNAHHAMREREQGGTLEVVLEEVHDDPDQGHILSLTAGSYLKLTVRDTGCGMTSDVQEHIFEPFFSTKEPGKGTGLGLSIVHGIVKGHQGVITVESEPGKGTTFRILFPTTDAIEPQEDSVQTELVRRGKESILIVDDESNLTALYELALTKLGYHVTTLTDSYEALETFRADPDQFDVVFTDQTMPRMTGAQLSRELLHIRPNLPIILATGYSDTISEREAKILGVRHFLMKPVKLGTLIRIIRKIFE